MCVCGALFRDLEWTIMKRLKRSITSLSGSENSHNMPEIEELRALLETGGVAEWLEEERGADQTRLATSLLTLPTYIKVSFNTRICYGCLPYRQANFSILFVTIAKLTIVPLSAPRPALGWKTDKVGMIHRLNKMKLYLA